MPTAGTIAAAAAPNIVPLSFELGGKSPLLVFDDADLDLAVDLAVEQFDNAGQVCLAPSASWCTSASPTSSSSVSSSAPRPGPGRPA